MHILIRWRAVGRLLIIALSLGVVLGCSGEEAPAGTENDPLTWLVAENTVAADDLPAAQELLSEIAGKVYERTGFHIRSSVRTEEDILAAISSTPAQAHLAVMSTPAYLRASGTVALVPTLIGLEAGEAHSEALFFVRSDSDVNSFEDLRGSRIGTPGEGSFAAHSLTAMLLAVALPHDDEEPAPYSILRFETDAELLRALYRNEIDLAAVETDLRATIAEEAADMTDEEDITYQGIETELRRFAPGITIPHHSFQLAANLPGATQRQIANVLMQLSYDRRERELLRRLFGWSGLDAIDAGVYDELKELMRDAGIEASAIPVGR